MQQKEKELIPTTKCKNCGVTYTLKKGPPEICWVCGLRVDKEMWGK